MTNTMMTLDTAMQDLITKTVAAAETAGDFVVQEAPIVVEQLLAWNFAFSLIWFIGGATMFMITVIYTALFWRKKWHQGDDELMGGLGIALPVVSTAIATFLVCCNLTWLKIAIAPKLYLLEYAADLIK